MTDDHDRNVLNAYGRIWLDASIFQPDFSFDSFGVYRVTTASTLQEMLEFVHKLPANETATALGMYLDASTAFRAADSLDVLDKVSLCVSDGIFIQETSLDKSDQSFDVHGGVVISSIKEILQKLPQDSEQNARHNSNLSRSVLPVEQFLYQEMLKLEVCSSTLCRYFYKSFLFFCGLSL